MALLKFAKLTANGTSSTDDTFNFKATEATKEGDMGWDNTTHIAWDDHATTQANDPVNLDIELTIGVIASESDFDFIA